MERVRRIADHVLADRRPGTVVLQPLAGSVPSAEAENLGGGHDSIGERPEIRLCDFPRSGRYHQFPRRIEDDYALSEKVLGSGQNGEVRMAVRTRGRRTVQLFAVKALTITNLSAFQMDMLQSEVENFLSMDHPHITRLYDVYESEQQLHLVMECMEGGELFDRVAESKALPEEEAADVMWQMLLAVNYIHSHGIVHRDLKLENFLYAAPGCRHLKLIDFGFSKAWDPQCKKQMQASLGSLPYIAPEVRRQRYTSQCDLWSLGVIAFVLLRGFMPFSDSAVLAGFQTLRRQRWRNVSHSAAHFVEVLLEVDPDERFTAQEALEHPWLAQRQKQHNDVCCGILRAMYQLRHTSPFRRACMQMVAWSLSNAERAKVREYFLSLALDQQGIISFEELKRAMCPLGASCDDVHATFAALDYDCDKEIQYSDFLAAMVCTKIPLRDELICAAFQRFDTDGTGHITATDLKNVLGETFKNQSPESLLLEAKPSDTHRLSYKEFADFLRTKDSLHTPVLNVQ